MNRTDSRCSWHGTLVLLCLWAAMVASAGSRSLCAEDELSLDKELSKESSPAKDQARPKQKTSEDDGKAVESAPSDPAKRAKNDDDVDLEKTLPDGEAKGDKLMEQLNKAIGTMGRARRALSSEKEDLKSRTSNAKTAQTDAVADLDELIRLIEEEMNQPPPQQGEGGGGAENEPKDGEQSKSSKENQGGQKTSSQKKRRSLAGMGKGANSGRQPLAIGKKKGPAGTQPDGRKEQRPGGDRNQQVAGKTPGRDQPQPTGSEEGVRKNNGAEGGEDPKGRLAKDVWGHLPPQLREQMLNVYTEKYLPKYEDMVRSYYEALAEQSRRREAPAPESRRNGSR